MFDFLIVPLSAILVAGLVGAGYLIYRRRRQRKAIDDILFDVNPLGEWTYSPEEWRSAVDQLSWGSANDGATLIRICRSGIYFKNPRREHLIPLNNGTRVVTFAGYRGGENPLKLRTRWRVVTQDRYGREEKNITKKISAFRYRRARKMRRKMSSAISQSGSKTTCGSIRRWFPTMNRSVCSAKIRFEVRAPQQPALARREKAQFDEDKTFF